jgi:secretory carrier-associated membrane protein
MVIGIPGTGTAGLILTVIAFKHGHIVAGVFCVIACVGWIVQTVGNAFYYHKVRSTANFEDESTKISV